MGSKLGRFELNGKNLFYKLNDHIELKDYGDDYSIKFLGVWPNEENKKVVNIKDYIINENATVIFWEDGTKTVVKKTKEDKFDKRLGLLIGYFQKNCGMSKTKANRYLDSLIVTGKKKKEEN